MSQINTLKCDECDDIAVQAAGWVRLDVAGIDVTTMMHKRFPADVCSQECARKYLAQTALAPARKEVSGGA